MQDRGLPDSQNNAEVTELGDVAVLETVVK